MVNILRDEKGKFLKDSKWDSSRKSSMFGKKHSEETNKLMRESAIKRGISDETRAKMTKTLKSKYENGEIEVWNKGKKGRMENHNIEGLKLGHGWNKGKKLGFIPQKAFKEGQIPWNKNKEQKATKGENNPRWKGGITALTKQIRCCFQYRQWRSDIFTRDDFTCQKCGLKGGRLHAHHIKPFSRIIEYYEITTFEEALECEELWNINNGITLCKKCHLREGDNYDYKRIFKSK